MSDLDLSKEEFDELDENIEKVYNAKRLIINSTSKNNLLELFTEQNSENSNNREALNELITYHILNKIPGDERERISYIQDTEEYEKELLTLSSKTDNSLDKSVLENAANMLKGNYRFDNYNLRETLFKSINNIMENNFTGLFDEFSDENYFSRIVEESNYLENGITRNEYDKMVLEARKTIINSKSKEDIKKLFEGENDNRITSKDGNTWISPYRRALSEILRDHMDAKFTNYEKSEISRTGDPDYRDKVFQSAYSRLEDKLDKNFLQSMHSGYDTDDDFSYNLFNTAFDINFDDEYFKSALGDFKDVLEEFTNENYFSKIVKENRNLIVQEPEIQQNSEINENMIKLINSNSESERLELIKDTSINYDLRSMVSDHIMKTLSDDKNGFPANDNQYAKQVYIKELRDKISDENSLDYQILDKAYFSEYYHSSLEDVISVSTNKVFEDNVEEASKLAVNDKYFNLIKKGYNEAKKTTRQNEYKANLTDEDIKGMNVVKPVRDYINNLIGKNIHDVKNQKELFEVLRNIRKNLNEKNPVDKAIIEIFVNANTKLNDKNFNKYGGSIGDRLEREIFNSFKEKYSQKEMFEIVNKQNNKTDNKQNQNTNNDKSKNDIQEAVIKRPVFKNVKELYNYLKTGEESLGIIANQFMEHINKMVPINGINTPEKAGKLFDELVQEGHKKYKEPVWTVLKNGLADYIRDCKENPNSHAVFAEHLNANLAEGISNKFTPSFKNYYLENIQEPPVKIERIKHQIPISNKNYGDDEFARRSAQNLSDIFTDPDSPIYNNQKKPPYPTIGLPAKPMDIINSLNYICENLSRMQTAPIYNVTINNYVQEKKSWFSKLFNKADKNDPPFLCTCHYGGKDENGNSQYVFTFPPNKTDQKLIGDNSNLQPPVNSIAPNIQNTQEMLKNCNPNDFSSVLNAMASQLANYFNAAYTKNEYIPGQMEPNQQHNKVLNNYLEAGPKNYNEFLHNVMKMVTKNKVNEKVQAESASIYNGIVNDKQVKNNFLIEAQNVYENATTLKTNSSFVNLINMTANYKGKDLNNVKNFNNIVMDMVKNNPNIIQEFVSTRNAVDKQLNKPRKKEKGMSNAA